MKKRFILLLTLLLCFPTVLQAQENESKPTFNHWLSIYGPIMTKHPFWSC